MSAPHTCKDCGVEGHKAPTCEASPAEKERWAACAAALAVVRDHERNQRAKAVRESCTPQAPLVPEVAQVAVVAVVPLTPPAVPLYTPIDPDAPPIPGPTVMLDRMFPPDPKQLAKLDAERPLADALGIPLQYGNNYSTMDTVNKKRAFLESWGNRLNITQSCIDAGVARRTFYTWRDEDTEFAKHVEDIRESRLDLVEDSQYMRAIDLKNPSGVAAANSILKAHRSQHYHERRHDVVSGPGGGPIVHVWADLSGDKSLE